MDDARLLRAPAFADRYGLRHEPGGAAGYCATNFGGPNFGAIWGMCTLVCMAIGPSLGTIIGAVAPSATGNPMSTIYFGLGMFAISFICGLLLPKEAPKVPQE